MTLSIKEGAGEMNFVLIGGPMDGQCVALPEGKEEMRVPTWRPSDIKALVQNQPITHGEGVYRQSGRLADRGKLFWAEHS